MAWYKSIGIALGASVGAALWSAFATIVLLSEPVGVFSSLLFPFLVGILCTLLRMQWRYQVAMLGFYLMTFVVAYVLLLPPPGGFLAIPNWFIALFSAPIHWAVHLFGALITAGIRFCFTPVE